MGLSEHVLGTCPKTLELDASFFKVTSQWLLISHFPSLTFFGRECDKHIWTSSFPSAQARLGFETSGCVLPIAFRAPELSPAVCFNRTFGSPLREDVFTKLCRGLPPLAKGPVQQAAFRLQEPHRKHMEASLSLGLFVLFRRRCRFWEQEAMFVRVVQLVEGAGENRFKGAHLDLCSKFGSC